VKVVLTVAALLGVVFGIWLILHFGLDQVGQAFLSAGWQGMLAVSAVYFASLALCAGAWQALLVSRHSNMAIAFFWARWLRESTNNLIAIVPAMGEMVGVRELTLRGLRVGTAAATTVVDLTLELASQLVFTLLGVAILLLRSPSDETGWQIALGVAVFACGLGGFFVAQHKGLFGFIETLPDRLGWTRAWGSASENVGIHAGIKEIYRHRGRVAVNFIVHLAAWVVGAAEAWVALWFMGHPVGFAEALVIESLVHALRGAAFVVPWGAGVQEGGFIVAGALFGLSPQLALGLALLRRAREIITGVPSLIIWQGLEPWRLWKRRDRSSSQA
jgi:putative membrane protein